MAGYAISYFARGLVGGVRWFGGYGLVLLADGGIRLVVALPLVFVASPTIAAVAIAAAAAGGALAPLFSRDRTRLDAIGEGTEQGTFAVGAAARFALPAAVIAGCEQVLISGGPLLVLIVGGEGAAAAAGVLFAATLLLRAPVFVFQGVAASLLPNLTTFQARGDQARLHRATALVALAMAGFAALLALGAIVAGPVAMDVLYGAGFDATRADLALLAVGIGGFLAAGTFCQALLARGQGGRAAALWTVSAVTFVVLQLSLDGSEFHRVSRRVRGGQHAHRAPADGGRLEGTRMSVARLAARREERPTIMHVVGARPNFVKMAPVVEALDRSGAFDQFIVHTGQHYDARMSEDVLADLDFPVPDRFLGVGSGPHGEQTAKVLTGFEQVLFEIQPRAVVVAGDVNSTLACALAASKLGIPVAHLEAGLRSGDWTMPEEINRVLTDRLSEVLLTHSPEALDNLLSEGIDPARVHYVGNTMIDSLRRCEKRARARAVHADFGLADHEYVLVTFHRPGNVDHPLRLDQIVIALIALAAHCPVVFPMHPRTRARLAGQRQPQGARGRGRPLHRSARLPRLPLAAGGRRRDRHRLRRHPGGGVRARRELLHLPPEHRAPRHAHARHKHAARRRPDGDRPRPAVRLGPDAVGDPALGRPRRRAGRRRAGRALRARARRGDRAVSASVATQAAPDRVLVGRPSAADARAARRLVGLRARLGDVRQVGCEVASEGGAGGACVQPDEPQHPQPAAEPAPGGAGAARGAARGDPDDRGRRRRALRVGGQAASASRPCTSRA